MNTPIVVDLKDPKWLLLDRVMAITNSRLVKQSMARHGVIPVEKAGTIIRILFISMFFSLDITFLLSELRKRKKLRQIARVSEVPSAQSIYQFVSKFEESQFIHLISGVLNSMCRQSSLRKYRKLIVDGSAITLDLNIFRRKFRKKDLLDRDFRWGFSNTRGYYLGFKLTLVLEYPKLLPLCVLLHSGSPHDSSLFEEIMDELKRRRIIRNGDIIIFDKGYFSTRNYQLGVLKYRTIPVIFPRSNFDINKAFSKMCYPLPIYSRHDFRNTKHEYEKLVSILARELHRWEDFLAIRSTIEDFFKLVKDALSLKLLHRYSRRSVLKFICIDVLLAGIIILTGFRSKKQIQALAEW
jgi:hypothetical protein